jgi:tRNA modification GTPase
MNETDTIVAVSTPAGYALRAIVRLSGPAALPTAARRFGPRELSADWQRSFRATAGVLRLDSERLEVPVVVYVMRAPRSYTREDVVELHLPGSPALLDMVLDDLLAGGAADLRLARPGEFTERAFLNGRIDLAQAEAVLAVIRARNEAELLAATAKLRGRVSEECAAVQNELADLRALIEAALDFAEHGIELVRESDFLERCARIRQRLAAEVEKGRDELASDGRVHVVLCGPPNAGKSSLLNRLAGREVALVHHAPGTTRDPVREEIEVEGISFALTDTAGLRAGASGVEEIAARRAAEAACSAQLVVLVLDGSAEFDPAPAAALREVDPKRILCVVNKCDLPQVLHEGRAAGAAGEVVHVSALTGEGIGDLRAALGRVVLQGRLDASAADCLFNARQREAVRRALRHIGEAEEAAREGMGYEFAAVGLRDATDALGEVTGQVGAQDVLSRIFSRLCVGK